MEQDAAFQPPRQRAAFDVARALFSFDGCLDGRQFWIGWGWAWAAGLLFGLVGWLGGLLFAPMVWANTALSVKRLRDAGRSAWWTAAPAVLTLCGLVYALVSMSPLFEGGVDTGNMDQFYAILGAILFVPAFGFLVSLVFMVIVGLLPSERGSMTKT